MDNNSKIRNKAQILAQALPYMRRYSGKTVVIKYGGNAMAGIKTIRSFANDIVMLRQARINPVIIHGGGPQIGDMLNQLGIKSQFNNGLRITSAQSIKIVEMVLSGSINTSIVSAITQAGGKAIGISGKDGGFVTARKVKQIEKDISSNIERIIDLGFVGVPEKINRTIIDDLLDVDFIPVIAPIATGKKNDTYNINADTMAGAIAGALKAARMILLTDVDGVFSANGEVIPYLNLEEAQSLINKNTISGGMIPKIKTCIDAISNGVRGVAIINGLKEHSILTELFTDDGIGTLIKKR